LEPFTIVTFFPVRQTEAEKTSPFLVYLDVPPVTLPVATSSVLPFAQPVPPTLSFGLLTIVVCLLGAQTRLPPVASFAEVPVTVLLVD
jgi:hypothetical protein